MILLKDATIHNYKSVETDQSFEVDKGVTCFVGLNESGKTSILEALAKTNYFEKDKKFKFDTTHDYPRKDKRRMEKNGEIPDAVTCTFLITDALFNNIEVDLGQGIVPEKTFSRTTTYDNRSSWISVSPDIKQFVSSKMKQFGITDEDFRNKLEKINSPEDLDALVAASSDYEHKDDIISLKKYFENKWDWEDDPLGEYVTRKYLKPNLPKYLYYDEFYALPSRINIEELQTESLELEEQKTAKALFELADIDINELTNSDNFEDFKAELEATETIITEELFKYWSTNRNIAIQFDLDKKVTTDPKGKGAKIEHILDIRVRNTRTRVSLPLKNRSKGFNWFFSFLVWFKKVQEDPDSNYILLLDEPGLNLHASAQADLLAFIEHLSEDYQIIYSTHSPFMIDSSDLSRVRTVVETETGTKVSDSSTEKDPKTIFPLQASLGYNIAKNLFIAKNNLLVESVSDLIYLWILSGIMEESGKTFLRGDITVVPVGGLHKVSAFVSLIRGNQLDAACLFGSAIDDSCKSKLEHLIEEEVIQEKKILFFDEFIPDKGGADIEDMFSKKEYLKLFNETFSEYKSIEVSDLNSEKETITFQIKDYLDLKSFNLYRPANTLAKKGVDISAFSKETIKRFEDLFAALNSLFLHI